MQNCKRMTKKPSEKNKAWEKERRDRLNKAFDQLAELLPQYDPTINWSKNEIIQKSISHIKELHEKHRDFLTKGDPDILRLHDELIDCIKYFHARNRQLADLLKKAKISIPALKLPKFLEDNPKISEENNFNNINIQSIGRPKKYSNKFTSDDVGKLKKNNTANEDTKENENTNTVPVAVEDPEKTEKSTHCDPISVTSNTAPVTSDAAPVMKNSVAVTSNIVRITSNVALGPNNAAPIISNPDAVIGNADPVVNSALPEKSNVTSNTTPVTRNAVPVTSDTAPKYNNSMERIQPEGIATTGLLFPVIPCPISLPSTSIPPTTSLTATYTKPPFINVTIPYYRKCRVINLQTFPKNLKYARDKNGKVKILPRPGFKLQVRRVDGKLPIPMFKRKILPAKKRTRKRKAENLCTNDSKSAIKMESEPKKAKKSDKKETVIDSTKANENFIATKNNTQVIIQGIENIRSSTTLDTDKEKSIENEQPSIPNTKTKDIEQPLLSASDLPNDYFSTLQIPQNESNSECLSPTAAFLMSFPVVTTSNGKNNEITDDSAVLNSSLISNEERRDTTVTNAVDNFDNLNTFFTTKEYHRFCNRNSGKKLLEKKDENSNLCTNNLIKCCEQESNAITKPACEIKPSTFVKKEVSRDKICTFSPQISSSGLPINLLSYPSNYVSSSSKQKYEIFPSQHTSSNQTMPNFTFNLTTCTQSVSITSNSMSKSQSLTTYSTIKSDIPWMPSVTSDYKSSFTFSLTPTITSYSNANKRLCDTNASNKTFSTLPLPISSETTTKSTYDAFEYTKMYDQANVNSLVSTACSYSSLNFTFSLTNPKNSITTVCETKKTTEPVMNSQQSIVTTCLGYKYQAYPTYGFDTQAQFYPKDTTNFTFALTGPTKTTTTPQCSLTSFSIDNTLGTGTSHTSTNTKKTPIVSSYAANCSKSANKNVNNVSTNAKSIPSKEVCCAVNAKQSFYCYDNKVQKSSQKNHVNWMTSSDMVLPPIDFGPTPTTSSYFPTQVPPALEIGNRKSETYFSHGTSDENYPAWSPSKVLDTSHLLPPTSIQNYYPDLGFNNTNYSGMNNFDNTRSYTSSKMYENNKIDKPYKSSVNTNNNNQANFFSVSQLVDQGTTNSKNFDSCTKKSSSINKTKEMRRQTEKLYEHKGVCSTDISQNNNFSDQILYQDTQKSIASNIYSAEALISKKEKHRSYSFATNSEFYNPVDTGTSTFATSTGNVDHNCYNSNYFYNYVPSQNYIQETDYLGAYSGEAQYGKSNNKLNYSTSNNAKATLATKNDKRNQLNSSLPPPIAPPPPPPPTNIVSYDSNYFPVPLAVNSPIIPVPGSTNDVYDHHTYSHTSNFQHAAWNSKNSFPTYHHGHFQQMLPTTDLATTNGSATITNNQGSSGNLTNFNLSTICPEINDKSNQSGQTTNLPGHRTNLQIFHQ